MPLSAPGTRPTLLLTFASTGGYPSPISVGKVISVPEPTTVLMVPAATPAPKIARAWVTGMLTSQRYPPALGRPVPRRRDHHDTPLMCRRSPGRASETAGQGNEDEPDSYTADCAA